MKMRHAASLLAFAAFATVTASCRPPPATTTTTTTEIRRTLIGREPTQDPGWETRLYLIEYPPRAVAPAHVHPVVGVGWVIEGEFESAFGDDVVATTHAGQGFVDRAGMTHRVFRNPSSDHTLRFVIAYTMRPTEEPFRLVAGPT